MGANAIPTDLRFVHDIDWTKPNAKTADGVPCFEVRCKIPFHFDSYGPFGRVIEDDGDGILLEPNSSGDTGDNDEVNFNQMGGVLLNGVASSTSVDFYGTEMSLRALKLMAMQMMMGGEGGSSGIPYLPQHNHGLSGPTEWHEVIGRTVHAEVVPVEEVRNPYNEAETQFILRVSIKLFDELKSRALIKRLSRGEPIGQSIGGWFTALQIINNEDGDVERVIVQGVELDHLAVTRAPANPDSDSLLRLRSILEGSITEFRATRSVVHMDAGQTVVTSAVVAEAIRTQLTARVIKGTDDDRHVLNVVDNDDGTVSVRFEVAETGDDEEARPCDDEMSQMTDDEPAAGARPEDDDGRTVDTHEQVEAMCSLEVEERDGKVHLSWNQDEPPENLRAAYRALLDGEHGETVKSALETASAVDEPHSSGDTAADGASNPAENNEPSSRDTGESDTIVSDAPRSAHTDAPTSPDAGNAGAPSEEHAMPVNEETLAAFSELLDSKLEPVVTRLSALEIAPEPAPIPAPTPVPAALAAPAADDPGKVALDAALARAKQAEDTLAAVLSQPVRVGLSAVMPSIPGGAGGGTALDGLIGRARTDAPAMALLIERMKPQIIDEKSALIGPGVLEMSLTQVLCAAEVDGIITPPTQRAHWQ